MVNETRPWPRRGARVPAYARPGFNWRRFWIRMVIAMVLFNVLAALVTWFFIFPRLHPGH